MENISYSFRYSLFLACSFTTIAFVAGFLPIYCTALGHNSNQIAFLSSTSILASMLMGPVLVEAAHRFISPKSILRIFSITSMLLYIPLIITKDYHSFLTVSLLWFVASYGLFSFFDTYIIRETALRGIKFEIPRAWGSIGFVIFSFFIGLLYDYAGSKIIIYAGFACPFLTFLAGLFLAPYIDTTPIGAPKSETPQNISMRPYYSLLAILISLGICQWIAHGPLFVFFSLYLQHLGASGSEISCAWMIMVLAEIFFFFKFSFFEKFISLNNILRLSLVISLIRWAIIYYSDNLFLIYLSQLLHAFSYVGVALSSIKLVSYALPKELSTRAQSILSSLAMSLGAFLGRAISGYGMTLVGDISKFNELFLYAIILSTTAFIISLFLKDQIPGSSNFTAESLKIS